MLRSRNASSRPWPCRTFLRRRTGSIDRTPRHSGIACAPLGNETGEWNAGHAPRSIPHGLPRDEQAGRGSAFYRDALGLTLSEESEFALVFDASGTMLRVQKVEQFTPQPFTVLGWQVDDVERIVSILVERGIQPERYPGLGQDRFGAWISPDGARTVWFRDPDGNILSLTQFPA
ncbi:MAG TPA: VOC family protein [Dehalococcoidia bacterium]|nr:VOC family protein [Dehalococcoidia bacterium]